MMRTPRKSKLGPIEWILIAAVVGTVSFRIAAAWPASAADVAALQVLASGNATSEQVVKTALSIDPSPSRQHVMELRRQLLASERVAADPHGGAHTATAMAREERRLSTLSLSDMSMKDLICWLLLALNPLLPFVLGACLAIGAWLSFSKAKKRAQRNSKR